MPVYEEYFVASRTAQVSDVVPWRSMIAPGVMLQAAPRAPTLLCRVGQM